MFGGCVADQGSNPSSSGPTSDLYKLDVPSCLSSILNPCESDTLDTLLEKLKGDEDLSELNDADFDLVELIQDFLINKSFNTIKSSILDELKIVSRN